MVLSKGGLTTYNSMEYGYLIMYFYFCINKNILRTVIGHWYTSIIYIKNLIIMIFNVFLII